jgi:tryptophan synthase alpha chain
MSNSIMCHMVAGFPTEGACLELVTGLLKLPITALEIQIPFSDPIADGEAIMEANDVTHKKFSIMGLICFVQKLLKVMSKVLLFPTYHLIVKIFKI